MLVRREQRRLGVVFRRALILAVTGAGCGSTTVEQLVVQADAGADAQSPVDSGADAPHEASVDRCLGSGYKPPVADTCGDYYTFPCGLPTGLTSVGDCYFAVNDCNSLCPDIHYNCHAIAGYCSTNQGEAGVPDGGDAEAGPTVDGIPVPDEAGAIIVDCSVCPGSAGRLPAGFTAATETRGASVLGAYYANAAQLEAASVTAFVRLHDDLAMLGAPAELCAAARDAARDEVKHTLAMARLARAHGSRYERPVVASVGARTLAEIAEENVVEGCARETFSALLAAYQASHARDAHTRDVLTQIATDEARHAALSWAVARWTLAQLDAADRARIVASWDAAMSDVACASDDRAEAVASVAALPSREERLALAAELRTMRSSLAA